MMEQKDFLLYAGVLVGIILVASVLSFATGDIVRSGARICIDSDSATYNGYNTHSVITKGSATSIFRLLGRIPIITSRQDVCSGNLLREAYCTTDARVAVTETTCFNGCSNGACIAGNSTG